MEVKKLKNILTPLEKRVQYQLSGRQTTGTGQEEPGDRKGNEMKLTITKTAESAGKETWTAAVEGFEDAAERFTHYTAAGFHFVTLGVSSLKSERADCKDGDVLAAICEIAGMKIESRIDATSAEVSAEVE